MDDQTTLIPHDLLRGPCDVWAMNGERIVGGASVVTLTQEVPSGRSSIAVRVPLGPGWMGPSLPIYQEWVVIAGDGWWVHGTVDIYDCMLGDDMFVLRVDAWGKGRRPWRLRITRSGENRGEGRGQEGEK